MDRDHVTKLQWHRMILVVALVLVSASAAFGKAAFIPLPKKAAESDLIARVRILSTRKLQGSKDYRSIARVKVARVIKGLGFGRKFDLEFDNGLGCPNVHYSKGDDCLIFAVRMANGHYQTYNAYYGKIDVKETRKNGKPSATVSGNALGLKGIIPLEKAFEEIEKHVVRSSGVLPLDKKGNFVLYVSNQSFAITPVDITIRIDGKEAVCGDFDVAAHPMRAQHNWIKHVFHLSPGKHTLEAVSKKGEATLKREFQIKDKHWATVDYWYYPNKRHRRNDRHFSFTIKDKPIRFR